MSKARRSPKPKSKAVEKENERELRELVVFLEADVGFQLGLAAVDSITTRRTQLDRLSEALAGGPVHLTILDLGKFPGEEQILARLQEHLLANPASEGKKPAVMVIGLEAHLDYREPEPGKVSPQPILRNANLHRDAFPRLCPVPVVFWLFPNALNLFVREAPDLWHWRSGSFRFEGPPGTRQRVEEKNVGMSMIETGNLPRAEKAERIALLQDLLRELEHAEDHETKGNMARRANLLKELSAANHSVSKFGQALRCASEALELFRIIDSPAGLGGALGCLGNAYDALGQTEKAIECYEQTLEIARRLEDLRGEGLSTGNLGTAYMKLGSTEKAIEYSELALSIARQLGDLHFEEAALDNLGNACVAAGQREIAIRYYEQALSIARLLADLHGEAFVLSNLGTAHGMLGQTERAIGYLEQSLAMVRKSGDRRSEGRILNNLGSVEANLGQADKAATRFESGLAIGLEVNDPQLINNTEGNLKRLHRR